MYMYICNYIDKYIGLYDVYKLKKILFKENIDNDVLSFLYDLIDSIGIYGYSYFNDIGEILINLTYNDWYIVYCNNSFIFLNNDIVYNGKVFVEDLFKHPIMKHKMPYYLDLFV